MLFQVQTEFGIQRRAWKVRPGSRVSIVVNGCEKWCLQNGYLTEVAGK